MAKKTAKNIPGAPYATSTPAGWRVKIERKAAVMASGAASTKTRLPKTIVRRLINRALRSEEITPTNAALFLREAKRLARRPKILIIGGATVGTGAGAIYDDPDIEVIGSDIYRSDLTHIVAEGHQLPIADQTVQGVWIQAVLEHVLEPHVVATEIHRVLAPGGLVYAETPFMQQVHEGAYDFTRFTLSGHRWLFRGFEEIGTGFLRGPGTVMLWSIRYLVAGLFGTWKAGTAAAVAFFWLRFLDRLARPRFAADGPGGVFFLGRRSERELAPRDIISFYKGAQ